MIDPIPSHSSTNSEPATPTPLGSGPPAGDPIRSTLSGNTDMAELIEWFVENLNERTNELRAAWSAGDLLRIRVVAHQLKGSSAGYGFAALGQAAADLENATKAHDDDQADLDAILSNLEALVDLCSRAAA